MAAAAQRVLGADRALAVLGDSPSLPRRELDDAVALAGALGLALHVTRPGEQDDAGYRANAGNRCYFCKTHLYASLQSVAAERGFSAIANGANVDDTGDHRPGMDAAREARVVSPLLEAGLNKADVRALAAELGLPNADKPAAACLASRIPYGTEVTPERLAQVERAEALLADLGFSNFRVRHHDTVARLELPLDQFARLGEAGVRDAVTAGIRRAGFTYVALDLDGFRSGSGNAVLTIGASAGAAAAPAS